MRPFRTVERTVEHLRRAPATRCAPSNAPSPTVKRTSGPRLAPPSVRIEHRRRTVDAPSSTSGHRRAQHWPPSSTPTPNVERAPRGRQACAGSAPHLVHWRPCGAACRWQRRHARGKRSAVAGCRARVAGGQRALLPRLFLSLLPCYRKNLIVVFSRFAARSREAKFVLETRGTLCAVTERPNSTQGAAMLGVFVLPSRGNRPSNGHATASTMLDASVLRWHRGRPPMPARTTHGPPRSARIVSRRMRCARLAACQ